MVDYPLFQSPEWVDMERVKSWPAPVAIRYREWFVSVIESRVDILRSLLEFEVQGLSPRDLEAGGGTSGSSPAQRGPVLHSRWQPSGNGPLGYLACDRHGTLRREVSLRLLRGQDSLDHAAGAQDGCVVQFASDRGLRTRSAGSGLWIDCGSSRDHTRTEGRQNLEGDLRFLARPCLRE